MTFRPCCAMFAVSLLCSCAVQDIAEQPARDAVLAAKQQIDRILTGNVLPFWHPGTLDTEHGGYRLNHDTAGVYRGPADKYIVTQARTMWFFARLSRSVYGTKAHLDAATHGYEFLRDRMWDDEFGGFYWAVDSSGARTLLPDKHLYGQSFGLYALSEYYLASKDPEAKALAMKLADLIETHAYDRDFGGYIETFAPNWTPRTTGRNYMGVETGLKLMNTHLHLLEALTAYYAATNGPLARERLHDLVLIQSSTVVRGEIGACTDKFERDWTPLTGPEYDRVSYGHDLENVWLLIAARNALGLSNAPLMGVYDALFNYSRAYGYDAEHGGFYDSGPFNAPADRRQKTWWVQAECMLSALWMYRLTADPAYFECFRKTLDWIAARQVDGRRGDWHADILPNGAPSGDKAGPWKGPYHNGRALIEASEILEDLLDVIQE